MKATLLLYGIAAVWFINGFFCKVLNLVPRHQQIVARILGDDYAPLLTKLIGFGEIAMAIWILSGLFPRWNTYTQIALIATMNVLEFFLVPDLLLWGHGNIVFAAVLIGACTYKLQLGEA
ncbi:MAG: hypothetical protein RLZZ292_441 [Bacteroidota bacterium]|jgi:uncharacterized membrane protein YphA (DoxX/SURF4 family)